MGVFGLSYVAGLFCTSAPSTSVAVDWALPALVLAVSPDVDRCFRCSEIADFSQLIIADIWLRSFVVNSRKMILRRQFLFLEDVWSIAAS